MAAAVELVAGPGVEEEEREAGKWGRGGGWAEE